MSSVLIKNVRIIDPSLNTDSTGNLLIKDGQFESEDAIESADQIINAQGLVACPGMIDLYARLREPGQETKATITSETRAALSGGITTIVCSPDTDPVIDETATVELIHRRAEDAGFARVLPLAAMTQKLDGSQISELATLRDAGCIAASNADQPISDSRTLRSIMEYAATFNIKLSLVALDESLALNGVMHEGIMSTRLGLIGIPVAAETVALSMILELVWQTGASIHLSRISSARGIDLVREAKQRGLAVTADTSINHLFLSDQNVVGFNSLCHTTPPLRSLNDQSALREALSDGTVDAICTNHAPHDPDAKLTPFPSSEPGISGLDVFLPLLLELVSETNLTLSQVFALTTINPARILGLDLGTLENGKPADLVLFDPNSGFECQPGSFLSKGKNSPYAGSTFNGKVQHCFVGGKHFAL